MKRYDNGGMLPESEDGDYVEFSDVQAQTEALRKLVEAVKYAKGPLVNFKKASDDLEDAIKEAEKYVAKDSETPLESPNAND